MQRRRSECEKDQFRACVTESRRFSIIESRFRLALAYQPDCTAYSPHRRFSHLEVLWGQRPASLFPHDAEYWRGAYPRVEREHRAAWREALRRLAPLSYRLIVSRCACLLPLY